MRILGVECSGGASRTEPAERTLVLLDEAGRVCKVDRVESFSAIAPAVGHLVGDDVFLLGVDVPVVVPAKPVRGRPVESLIRRRFGLRLPPGGRASSETGGLRGEALMAGLATAGLPSLPYPDRDRRRSGLAETHPLLILKALLWQSHSSR